MRRRAQGTILLEVVLALALFVLAAGIIIGGISSAVSAVRRLQIEAQASDLAVTTMSQIQLGTIPANDTAATPFDDVDLDGWTYAIATEPPDGATMPEGVLPVHVTIKYEPKSYTYTLSEWLPDPAFKPATQPASDGTTGGTGGLSNGNGPGGGP